MNFVKVISSATDNLGRRLVKVLRMGRQDIQTPIQVAPYGTDANPIKDMVALYAPAGMNGKNVIVGYINKSQLASPGEHRIFSTDASGALKAYAWLKNDGTIHFNGSVDNLVRYQKLDAALQAEVVKINAELAKIATAIGNLGGVYTVAPVTVDISLSKINDLKST